MLMKAVHEACSAAAEYKYSDIKWLDLQLYTFSFLICAFAA